MNYPGQCQEYHNPELNPVAFLTFPDHMILLQLLLSPRLPLVGVADC